MSPPEKIPGRTLLGKLRGRELIVKAYLINISSLRWKREFIGILDDALRLKDSEIFNRVLDTINKSYTRYIDNLEGRPDAAQFSTIVDEYLERLKTVYREIFLKALQYRDQEAVQLLLQYYSPTEDPILKRYFNDLITTKNYNLAKLLSPYISQ